MSDLDELMEEVQRGDIKRVRAILQTNHSLAHQTDDAGATALHYAAFHGHCEIVTLLLEAGADINSRDRQFDATPAGWAIEYLREKGGYLAVELNDLAYAIKRGDVHWVARFLERFPELRQARDTNGALFKDLAAASGNPNILELFRDNE